MTVYKLLKKKKNVEFCSLNVNSYVNFVTINQYYFMESQNYNNIECL